MSPEEKARGLSSDARKFKRALAWRMYPIALVLGALGLWVLGDVEPWRLIVAALFVFWASFLVSAVVIAPEIGDEAVRAITNPDVSGDAKVEQEALINRIERATQSYPGSMSALSSIVIPMATCVIGAVVALSLALLAT